MNKKQLVHIDDDTSINVDMSEDDRSKSSTLKKSFLVNNMSVINEEFPFNNQLVNKKENKNNDMYDLTSSADFYNSEGIGSYPLMMSDKKKEIFGSNSNDFSGSVKGNFLEKEVIEMIKENEFDICKIQGIMHCPMCNCPVKVGTIGFYNCYYNFYGSNSY